MNQEEKNTNFNGKKLKNSFKCAFMRNIRSFKNRTKLKNSLFNNDSCCNCRNCI